MTALQGIEGFRLSPQQERLWSLASGSDDFYAQAAVRLRGPIDPARLRQALESVVDTYEVLRTTYQRLPGMDRPLQVIEHLPPSFRVVDLSSAGAHGVRAAVESLRHEETATPFDLHRGPVLRACLTSHGRDRHVLLLTMPAMAADGAALATLSTLVVAAHEQLADDEGAVLQYADYCEWQHEVLTSDQSPEMRDAWRLPRQMFLASAPHQQAGTFAPVRYPLRVPPEVAADLARSCQRWGVALDVFLLAGWYLLEWRLRGEHVPMSLFLDGRRISHFRRALGLFGRYLPTSFAFDDQVMFADVLRIVGETIQAARGRQEFFSWTADAGPDSGPALLPVAFRYEERPASTVGGVSMEWMGETVRIDRAAMELEVINGGDETLVICVNGDGHAATLTDCARRADRFRALLARIVRSPDAPVARLDPIGEDERAQIVVDWNRTSRAYETSTTIHDRVAEQARRTPDAVAFVASDGELTYDALDRAANQLARYLRRRGVGPEARVALLTERGRDMAVGLLGTLKSGAAYVPIDLGYPRERIDWMLRDAGASIAVTDTAGRVALAAATCEVVCLASEREAIRGESAEALAASADPDGLAYVIYTSGSTGVPKGVMIRHRSVINLFEALRSRIYDGLSGPVRVSLNAPLAFDASVKQWVQWMAGHTVVAIPDEARRDGESLLAIIRDARLDVVDCTPTQLRLLLNAGLADDRRVFLVGGEPIDPALWSQLAAFRRTVFHNVYGPTECTVDTTTSRIAPEHATATIGRPLPNVRVYVTDRRLHPVALGLEGELLIGGAGVGGGYLGRPGHTAERYVPDPFSQIAGARLYCSGDRVRWLEGGVLEYLGRGDEQVKMRGHRIELGEIAAVLGVEPGVQSVVVALRTDQGHEERLVGYVVPVGVTRERDLRSPEGQAAAETLIAQLRVRAAQRLPEVMRPSAYVVLAHLPVTRNGKINRAALPPPPSPPPTHAAADAKTVFEEVLLRLWEDVLQTRITSVHDDFFALGGHSLLAARMISRVRAAFRVELPLRRLFDAPTVAGLAAAVEEERGMSPAVPSIALEPAPRDAPLPLSFAQQRLWFLAQLEPESPFYNCPAVVRISGALDVAAFGSSLSEVVHRHEVLRTTFTTVDDAPVQVIHPPTAVPVALVDLAAIGPTERDVQRWVQGETMRPFDLCAGPLLRATLLGLNRDEHILVLVLHHIVSDGGSVPLLVREVCALYGAFVAGAPSPLAPLPIQYADYAVWQRRRLSGEPLAHALAYWRRQLADAAADARLPRDRMESGVAGATAQRYRGAIPATVASALKALSVHETATLFMTLLTGVQVLVRHWAQSGAVAIGTPIEGRDVLALEPLIGCFMNTLVLRPDLSGNPTFREAIHRVRETVLGAFAHRSVPFERLVEELRPARAHEGTPFFELAFGLRNIAPEPLAARGLTLRPLEVGPGDARFDVTLWTTEEPDGSIGVVWTYRTDRFAAATIARATDQLVGLLAVAANNPDAPLSTLTIDMPAPSAAAAPRSMSDVDQLARALRAVTRAAAPRAAH